MSIVYSPHRIVLTGIVVWQPWPFGSIMPCDFNTVTGVTWWTT